MRRSILLAALAVLVASGGWAQVLDRPAATVRLTRTQSVTVSQLQKIVGPMETQYRRSLTKDERKQVLDQLIGTALIEQAADRDKIAVSDAEITARVQEYQKSLGTAANLGRPFTDQELQAYVRNNGMSWDEFQKQIKDQLLMFDYVRAKNKGLLECNQARQGRGHPGFLRFEQEELLHGRHGHDPPHLRGHARARFQRGQRQGAQARG